MNLYQFPYPDSELPCIRLVIAGSVSMMGTLLDDAGSTQLFTQGTQVHNAWHISWAASDTSTLSPALPELTSSKFVPTWVPGESIPPGMYDREQNIHDGVQIPQSLLWFLMVGLPILGALLIGCCIRCCVIGCRSKRRERRLAEHEPTTGE